MHETEPHRPCASLPAYEASLGSQSAAERSGMNSEARPFRMWLIRLKRGHVAHMAHKAPVARRARTVPRAPRAHMAHKARRARRVRRAYTAHNGSYGTYGSLGNKAHVASIGPKWGSYCSWAS